MKIQKKINGKTTITSITHDGFHKGIDICSHECSNKIDVYFYQDGDLNDIDIDSAIKAGTKYLESLIYIKKNITSK